MKLTLVARTQLLFFCLLIVNSVFAETVLVVSGTQVWKIDPRGTIGRVDYDFAGPGLQNSIHGTTGPVVSPDQKWIAFTRGNDLWVLDLAGLRSIQATKVGRPDTNQLASVYVLTTSWSADSRKILYHVERGETDDPDGTAPERRVRKAPYGDYVYDLTTRTSSRTFLPGDFRAWLLDGDFLVQAGEAKSEQLLRVHPGDKNGQLLSAEPGSYDQVEVKPNGQQILASRDAEIVLIDLVDGKTNILAKGVWAEYQWPHFSPSGMHFSYLRQYSLSTPGWYGHELLVDGASKYRSDKDFSFYWINDDTLALMVYERDSTKEPTWVFLDWKSGRERVLPVPVH
jgi:Dipeptidyl peptidase IV (DPP IV) N-terminal region